MTTIQWTDSTWNPTTGCSRVSEGCRYCYIERTPPFRMHGRTLGDPVQLHPDRLDQPLHWTKPRRVFVNSLSDLFHEDVPLDFIVSVYASMIAASWHTFQILTKRPERRRKLLTARRVRLLVAERAAKLINALRGPRSFEATTNLAAWNGGHARNIHEGVSVEDQPTADERIPILLQTPAAVRFVSAEPLLGPVDIRRYLNGTEERRGSGLQGCSDGRTGDRRRGPDMESGRKTMGPMDEENADAPLPASASRKTIRAVSTGSGNDRRKAGECIGSSSCLSPLQRTNTRQTDSKSREWKEAGQQSKESDASDLYRAADTRDTSAQGWACLQSERAEQLDGETHSGSGCHDSSQAFDGRAIEVDSERLRRIGSLHLEDSPRAPLGISWVIAGGESGPGARPCDLAWIRSIVQQCRSAGVPCFVKQVGSQPRGICQWKYHQQEPPQWLDDNGTLLSVSGAKTGDLCHARDDYFWPCTPKLNDRKGGDPSEWPVDVRVREFPR